MNDPSFYIAKIERLDYWLFGIVSWSGKEIYWLCDSCANIDAKIAKNLPSWIAEKIGTQVALGNWLRDIDAEEDITKKMY